MAAVLTRTIGGRGIAGSQTVETPGLPSIPDEFAKLGGVRKWEPTPFHQQKIVVLGLTGCGKTELVMSNQHAYVMDAELMANDVVYPMATRFPLESLEHYENIVAKLVAASKAGKPPCRQVVLDSVDTLITNYIAPTLNREEGAGNANFSVFDMDHGKGYFKIRDRLMRGLGALSKAGYGWVAVVHLDLEVHKSGSDVTYSTKPSLSASLIGGLYKESQILAVVNKTISRTKVEKNVGGKIVTVEGPKRTRFTLEMEPVDNGKTRQGKSRYLKWLRQVIELPERGGWQAVEAVYNNAIQEAKREVESGETTPPAADGTIDIVPDTNTGDSGQEPA